MEPKEAGIRVFCEEEYKGTCKIDNVAGIKAAKDTTPPSIKNVRANKSSMPCFDKFELTFELPDRYPDQFDPDQISVWVNYRYAGTTSDVIQDHPFHH